MYTQTNDNDANRSSTMRAHDKLSMFEACVHVIEILNDHSDISNRIRNLPAIISIRMEAEHRLLDVCFL